MVRFTFTLSLLLLNSVAAQAADVVLRGLQYKFLRGQQHAAEVLRSIEPRMLGSNIKPEVREFILVNRSTLIDDVLHSPLSWGAFAQATCAETTLGSRATVKLVAKICRQNVTSREQAGMLLLHESVHHLGFASESFADEVSLVVYSTWRRYGGMAAHWEEIPTTDLGSLDFYLGASPLWIGDKVLLTGSGLASDDRIYDPVLTRWLPIQTVGPNAGGQAIAWTEDDKDDVYVWGGASDTNPPGNGKGSILNVSTGTWRSISTVNAPSNRYGNKSFFSEGKLIVFGGYEEQKALFNGGIYDPISDKWKRIRSPLLNANYAQSFVAAKGQQMIFLATIRECGNWNCEPTLKMFMYSIGTDTWDEISTDGMAKHSKYDAITWLGDEVIVFGDKCYADQGRTCSALDTKSKTWHSLDTKDLPMGVDGQAVNFTMSYKDRWFYVFHATQTWDGFPAKYVFDAVKRTWSQLPTIGDPRLNVISATMTEEGLFVLGRKGDPFEEKFGAAFFRAKQMEQ